MLIGRDLSFGFVEINYRHELSLEPKNTSMFKVRQHQSIGVSEKAKVHGVG